MLDAMLCHNVRLLVPGTCSHVDAMEHIGGGVRVARGCERSLHLTHALRCYSMKSVRK